MTRSKPARLRMSLFASSALVGSSLAAGFAGLAVVATPGVASAACAAPVFTAAVPAVVGPPAVAAKAATTTETCTGTDNANIAADTGASNLTVTFNSETVTDGGVTLTDTKQTAAYGQVYGPANIALKTTGTAGAITNTAGAGVTATTTFYAAAVPAVTGPPAVAALPLVSGGSINIDTGASTVTGSTNAVNLAAGVNDPVNVGKAVTQGTESVTYNSSGTVTTTNNANYAVLVKNGGTGATTVTLNNVSDGGVSITGSGGAVTLTTKGAINNNSTTNAAISLTNTTGAVSYVNNSASGPTSKSAAAVVLTTTGNGALSYTATNQTAVNAPVQFNTTSGAITLNYGATATPASILAPVPSVTVGAASATGLAFSSNTANLATFQNLPVTSGLVTINLGAANKSGVNGSVTGITALTSVATLNGHIDFSKNTGGTTINLLGEQQATGQYAQSVWNLGKGTTTFSSGLDDIENRGIINIGQTQTVSSAQPSIQNGTVVTIDFGGSDASTIKDAKTTSPLLPSSSGAANSDRFTNQAGTASAASQAQYTPGTINIVGAGGALIIKNLESFVNDGTNNGGSGLINIRNNSNVNDFVTDESKGSGQLFFMNPGGGTKTTSTPYTDPTTTPPSSKTGTSGDALYSIFGLGSGYIRTLDIPNNTVPSGGVNMADGDTQDFFITTGAVTGNTALTGSPYSGARFIVDVNEASHKADQIWVGDTVGGVITIQPHFDGLTKNNAAGFDPNGIRVMTNVANPTSDTAVLIDYTGSSWYAAPTDATDQGLYRAQIEYRKDAGATTEDLSAFTGLGVAAPTATSPTGGYFLTFRPDTEFWQIASIGNAVQNLVRDARGNYLTRQTDMRDAVGDQALGTWVRISGSDTSRDESYLEPNVTTQREIVDRYWQSSTAVTVGADASTTTSYGKVAGGIFGGYLNSNVRFRAQTFGGLEQRKIIYPINYVPTHQENRTAIDGYQGGAYASLIGDTYFIDGSLDYTKSNQNSFFTSLQNAQFGTDAKTWDANILAGTRFISDDVLSIEPLVGLEYIRTTQSGLNFGPNVGATAITFPKLESLRPGVGFRVRAASATDLYKLNLGLTGMWYHETKKDGSVVQAVSNGQAFHVTDSNGTNDFADVGIDANVFMANGLSTLVAVSYRADFDDYQDLGLTTGIRYRW